MKTKEVIIGNIIGLNSYQLAVKEGKFDGTLQEYIEKEQEIYNQMVAYADAIKSDMERILASATEESSIDLSEVINARSEYSTLGERLNATDEELAIIIQRLNEIVDGAEKISVVGMDKNIEMRNNGTHIQWKFVGYTTWNNLIAVDDITPSFKSGNIEMVEKEEDVYMKITGTKNNPVLNLGIQKGKDGIDGGAIINLYKNENGRVIARVKNDSIAEETGIDDDKVYITPVFSIGKVETLPEDADAYATITGTPSNPILNFGIPRGKSTKITKGYIGEDGFLVFDTE